MRFAGVVRAVGGGRASAVCCFEGVCGIEFGAVGAVGGGVGEFVGAEAEAVHAEGGVITFRLSLSQLTLTILVSTSP